MHTSTVKTQMNLVHYFFHNFMGTTSTNSFLYCRVCTKNLISIKLRKLIILASKCTFFGINSLNKNISQMFIYLGCITLCQVCMMLLWNITSKWFSESLQGCLEQKFCLLKFVTLTSYFLNAYCRTVSKRLQRNVVILPYQNV